MAIAVTCACGHEMRAARHHAGMQAQCSHCGAVLAVPRDPGPPPLPPAPATEGDGRLAMEESAADPVEAEASGVPAAMCAACGERVIVPDGVACLACRGMYHVACWEKAGGCAVPTCEAGPRSRKRLVRPAEVETRLRPCPVCAEMIPEHAHRCRYCGEFTDRKLRTRKPRVRVPVKTSHMAGVSLIGGVIGLILVPLLRTGSMALPSILLPLTCIGVGVYAMYDIRGSPGTKSGMWTAGFGLGLNAIVSLYWVFNILAR